MNLSKLAVSTALMTGLIGITTVNRAEAFWRWGGSPNGGNLYDFLIDDSVIGETSSDGSIVYKNAVRYIKVTEGNGSPLIDASGLDLKIEELAFDISDSSTFPDGFTDTNVGETSGLPGSPANLNSPVPNTLMTIDLGTANSDFGPLSIFSPNGSSVSTSGSTLTSFFFNWAYSCRIQAEQANHVDVFTIGEIASCAEGNVVEDGETNLFAFGNPAPLALVDVEDVPEPASTLGLLVLGAVGTGRFVKRRLQLNK